MKVAVYSPARDEAHNVEAWAESAADADEIVLVDTGSTDDTVAVARGVEGISAVVQAAVVPWRFDDGFNVALAHVSADADVCVPLHLDERLQPGWRSALEAVWAPGVGRVTFHYQWSPEMAYRHDRIHARGHRWVGAAHEMTVGPGITVDSEIRVVQEPTERDRTADTGLMEIAYRESPGPRTAYYWARELFYRGRWVESREMFARYLAMDGGHPQERSEACLTVAEMVWVHERERWLLRACSEAPGRRECWVGLVDHYVSEGRVLEAAGAASRALQIPEPTPDNSFLLRAHAWDDEWLGRVASTGADWLT